MNLETPENRGYAPPDFGGRERSAEDAVAWTTLFDPGEADRLNQAGGEKMPDVKVGLGSTLH